MNKKFVPIETAIALKELGFPQTYDIFGGVTCHYTERGTIGYHSSIGSYTDIVCACPTYLDVWLWLWREKKIHIDIDNDCYGDGCTSFDDNTFEEHHMNDPEEAIIAAVDYLFTNNLIR